MATTLDDYLNDSGFDLDDYDLGSSSDYSSSDYDYSDLFSSDSSDSTTSTDYSDYFGNDSNDSGSYDTSSLDDLNDYLDNYGSSDSSSGDYSSGDYSSGDYSSGDYSSGDYGSGDYGLGDYSSGDYSNLYGNYDLLGNEDGSKTCISEAAFKTKGSKVDIAFDAIFFVLFLGLLGVAAFRFFKSSRKGAALGKWFLFIVSLFFALLHLLLDIITIALNECQMLGTRRYNLILAALRWFQEISIFTLIVLILIPICLKLQGAGKLSTLTVIVHGAWLAITGILLLTSLAINTRIYDAIYKRNLSKSIADLQKNIRGLSMAYYVFLFLASLLGAVNMGLSLFRKKNLQRGAILISVFALAISSVALTLTLMGGFADQSWPKRGRSINYYQNAQDAQIFLSRLFYVLAFLSALFIAQSHQEIDEPAAPAQAPPQVSQPVGYVPDTYPPAQTGHA